MKCCIQCRFDLHTIRFLKNFLSTRLWTCTFAVFNYSRFTQLILVTPSKRPPVTPSFIYTFHSTPNRSTDGSIFSPELRGDESRDWSAFPAGNERASLRGLFKQRLVRLQSCSRTARDSPDLLLLAWVIVPDPGPHHANVTVCEETL